MASQKHPCAPWPRGPLSGWRKRSYVRLLACLQRGRSAAGRPCARAHRAPTTPRLPTPGTIGHVAHGKSTVVKAITGVQTVRFKNELERNITIKLG